MTLNCLMVKPQFWRRSEEYGVSFHYNYSQFHSGRTCYGLFLI